MDSFARTLFNLSPAGIILYRPLYAGEQLVDFAFEDLNQASRYILRLPELPTQTFLQLYPHAEQEAVFAFYRDTFLSGKARFFGLDYPYDTLNAYFQLAAQRNGDLLVVTLTDLADRDSGKLITALQHSRQLEQQTRLELEARVRERTAQLAAQQEILQQILRYAPAAIATLHEPEHRFSFCNERYQQLVDHRATLGARVLDALPEAAEQGFVALLDRVYQTGELYLGTEVPIQLTQPAGPQQHYVNFTYQPLRDAQGLVEGILVFAVDVTEQVLARQHAEALQAAFLQEAQRRAQERQDLYQVFEQTPVAIVLLREPTHRVEYVNPAFAQVFPPDDWAGGELRGHTLSEVYPRMREMGLMQLLDKVFTTGESQTVLEMPLADLTPGSARYLTLAYQPYREQGVIVGVAAFAYDATEQVLARRQMEQLNQELATLNQALRLQNVETAATNDRLTRSNADLDAFVYTASHDLRSPIANIEGLMLALREELQGVLQQEPGAEHILQLVDKSVVRFQTTIMHLTNVLRLEQEGQQPAERIDLAQAVEDVRLDLSALLEQTEAELHVDIQACPTIVGSPKMLRSILYNLLSNAVKYHAPDRLPVVHLSAGCDEHWSELRVQDNGLGLTPEQQLKLFGLFKRLHDHVEGTGVGLYSIKKLIDNAGGTITVTSELGRGTTFSVRLPVAAH